MMLPLYTQSMKLINNMLLLLSHFSRVRLCATPWTAAHQTPPSLGFSRQEHWSGLPFPSPMHESEKWKWSHSVMSSSSWPHGLQPTRLLCPWDFPGKSTGVGCHCLLHPCPYFSSKKERKWSDCSDSRTQVGWTSLVNFWGHFAATRWLVLSKKFSFVCILVFS